MQINALNMLIAAQQARQAATVPSSAAPKTGPAPDAGKEFQPLPFETKATKAAVPPASAPLGSQIDIRV